MKNALEYLSANEKIAAPPASKTGFTETFESGAPNFNLVSGNKIIGEFLRRLTLAHLHQPFHADVSLLEAAIREQIQKVVRGLAAEIIKLMMQPDYLAPLRVVIAESARFPHLGELFRRTVPEQMIRSIIEMLERLRRRKLTAKIDCEVAAARMLFGSLLT